MAREAVAAGEDTIGKQQVAGIKNRPSIQLLNQTRARTIGERQVGNTHRHSTADDEATSAVGAGNGQNIGTGAENADIVADAQTTGHDVGNQARHGKGNDVAILGIGQGRAQRAGTAGRDIRHHNRRGLAVVGLE